MDSCQLIRKETKMEIVHFNQRQLDIEAYEESCLATSTQTITPVAHVGGR